VFIVDSLHSAPFRSDAEGHEGPRTKIEARIKAAVNLAIKHRVCFIATSELNRGSYRSRAQAEQVADLAAFKESSGIEYGADLGILLRSVPEAQNKVIEVSIAKNRLGESDVTFRLERGAHFTYTEAPLPERETGSASSQAHEARLERKVLEAIRISPEPLRSANDVYRITKGTKAAVMATFRRLTEEGRIVSVGGALRVAMPKEAAREERLSDETPSDRFERFEPVREPPN
jgi:hypothetical protein